MGDSRRDGRASNSIIATWHISFKYIQTKTPNAARLLSLMSLFDRQGIPESLLHGSYLEHGDGGADFDDDMDVLTSFSLVEMSEDGSEFKMHRLVQFSTKKWLELNCQLEKWKKTYVLLMDKNYPVGRYESWSVCQKLFPHAEVVVNSQPEDKEARKAWASLIHKSAWYALEMKQYSKSYDMYYVALQARETIFGLEHRDTLNSLNRLGVAVGFLGRYNEAEIMLKNGLQRSSRVLGEGHRTTLRIMADLSWTCRKQGKWNDAEELLMQVLEMNRTKRGADHIQTLLGMGDLASVYYDQGRWKDAEELLMQVIEMSKAKFGADHPLTLTSMHNIACIFRTQGKIDKAISSMQDCYAIYVKVLGPKHPDAVLAHERLASWRS